jgi:RNA polymerase sigma factor (sigma-70 family)
MLWQVLNKWAHERETYSMRANPAPAETHASIFLRLNQSDTRLREIAWQEFHAHYAPAIAALARQLGTPDGNVDDVVQDVLLGFFSTAPTFVYDPARGRFRKYLKACICHTVWKRTKRHGNAAIQMVGLDQINPQSLEIEQAWNDIWEEQLLRRAIEQVRAELGQTKTFRAFELYVMLDRPAQQVSGELGLHVDNVYRSKEQVTQLLRERIQCLREEE